LLDAGVLTEAELEERTALYHDHPQAEIPRRNDPSGVQHFLERLHHLESPLRDLDLEVTFSVGDTIRVRNLHPPGHTRLPRYVRGKQGVISRYYGMYDFQDAMPAGQADGAPQPLYAVRFSGRELWGDTCEPNSSVYIDMWERYLEAP
jgi:nitrile hydratase